MSELKPKPIDNVALEEVIQEIQRTALAIMQTGAALDELEKQMDELQQRKADIAGGQKFFMLEAE